VGPSLSINAVAVGLVAALVCGWETVRADIHRRHLPVNSLAVVLSVVVGFIGANLNGIASDIEREAWLAGAIAVALLVGVAAAAGISRLVMLDAVAPAAAVGLGSYIAVQTLALAGTGQAFTNIAIEAAIALAIAWWLWLEGRHASQLQRPNGIVIGEFLVLLGAGRVLMSLFAGAPGLKEEPWSVVAIALGGLLITMVLVRYFRGREEHRIIDHVATHGDALQPEYTPATPECPHPERWRMIDSMTAENEVLAFLKSLITTIKPQLVVETGTFRGISTLAIAEGLKENGFGRVITIEYDPKVFAAARARIEASGLTQWVEYRNQSSLDASIDGTIDILFSDSDQSIREAEVRRFLPQVSEYGLILVHDASSHYKIVREAVLRLEEEGLLSTVLLPTPRGLAMAQKKNGRQVIPSGSS
jgi:predicted O-methyltransferase YrrM